MFKGLYQSLVMTFALAVLLCGIYPLSVFTVGRLLFPTQSTGGIIKNSQGPVGATLIGQNFQEPRYFHSRPSGTGAQGYDAASSSGTNFGPTSKKFLKAVDDGVAKALAENPGLKKGQVPVDLVTASGSGLDPHLSVQAAMVQIDRVAKARGLTVESVRSLVEFLTEGRELGFLGQPKVNVLKLNLELDRIGAAAK